MELFSELYGAYFQAAEQAMRAARAAPLAAGELRRILTREAFSESAFYILPKLSSGKWPLLRETEAGYEAAFDLPGEMPLTRLQRAWLRGILDDPRMCLFLDDAARGALQSALADVPPLFRQEDFTVFDGAADGDDCADARYRAVFRVFLTAVRQKGAVRVDYEGGKGKRLTGVFFPFRLEYSQKDGKFRAHCRERAGARRRYAILNLARVTSAEGTGGKTALGPTPISGGPPHTFREMTMEISRERNALERCMVHFAHFEKQTEYDEKTGKYICTVRYNSLDETEVVVRVLSFGPTVRVLGPDAFLGEIRARVNSQAAWDAKRFDAQSRD